MRWVHVIPGWMCPHCQSTRPCLPLQSDTIFVSSLWLSRQRLQQFQVLRPFIFSLIAVADLPPCYSDQVKADLGATAAGLRSEMSTAVSDLKGDIGGVKSDLTAAEGRVTLLEQGHTRMAARQDDLADTASALRRDLDQLADDVAHKVCSCLG